MTDSFLPDEIVLDIITRFPAKDAIRCCYVCRRWRDLTWTRDFLDLHKQRQGIIPLILVENAKANWLFEHFLYDKGWEHARTKAKVHKIPIYTDYLVKLSHDGLIVLRETPYYGNYIILNPASSENVKLCLSNEMRESDIHGVFFHPSMNEYCTLWLTPPPALGNQELSQYKLLNLGPNPCWRNIKSPVGHRAKIGIGCTTPVFVDMYLYWMVWDVEGRNSSNIMEFDINIEELTLMIPPVQCNVFDKKLMNIAGVLSMVEICPSGQLSLVVDIWTLISRSEQLWTKSSFSINNDLYTPTPVRIRPIAVVDGELVLFSYERVFVCSLKVGTIRKFGGKFNSFATVFPHVMTVASLRNCKSEFCMGEKGEEECNTQWFRSTR